MPFELTRASEEPVECAQAQETPLGWFGTARGRLGGQLWMLSGGAPEPASLAVCVLMPSSTVEPKGNSSSFSGPCQWNVHPPDWYDSESAVGPVTKMVERPLASVNGNRWSLLRSSTTDSLPRTPICVRDGERVSRRRGFHSLRLQWEGFERAPGRREQRDEGRPGGQS